MRLMEKVKACQCPAVNTSQHHFEFTQPHRMHIVPSGSLAVCVALYAHGTRQTVSLQAGLYSSAWERPTPVTEWK